MEDVTNISWNDSTKNRLSRALHPRILLPTGYTVLMNIKPIGEIHKKFFNPHSAAPQMKYKRNPPKTVFYLEEKD